MQYHIEDPGHPPRFLEISRKFPRNSSEISRKFPDTPGVPPTPTPYPHNTPTPYPPTGTPSHPPNFNPVFLRFSFFTLTARLLPTPFKYIDYVTCKHICHGLVVSNNNNEIQLDFNTHFPIPMR